MRPLTAVQAGGQWCADVAVDYRPVGASRAKPIGFVDSRGPTLELSRAALFDDARAVAAGLTARGLCCGDRVVLVAATGPDYLIVLLGCLLAGVAPCTVAAPVNPNDPSSAGVRHLCAAVTVVDPVCAIVIGSRAIAGLPRGTPILTVDDLRGHGSTAVGMLPTPQPDSIHHIQMTSGSTASPKAVLLTHRNVAANLHALATSTGLQAGRDCISIWLPLHHDMGLVQVLLSLTSGIGLDLMSPVGFLRDPLSWLRHMDERDATLTGAPPFAYRTIAERQQRRPAADLDLSRIRQMYVGAEPLPIAALRCFRDAFADCGLTDEALVPCYGMAETVLASALALDVRPTQDVSFGRVRATAFDRAALDERRTAVPAIAGQPARTMVSCGQAVPGLTIRIVDDGAAELPDGQVGVITLAGSSLTSGYLTADAMQGPRQGSHDTGDLGVRHDGELYVVGRTQEMLDVDGRRLPPYDVEALIEEHPRVGAGHSAVFGHSGSDEGVAAPVVAFVETKAPDPDWPALSAQVTATVREAFALELADIVVVRRGTIPRTSSGKRRRAALRSAYLEGAAMPVTER